MDVINITPEALHAELNGDNPPKILDVREPHELEISVLPDVVNIPLGELQDRFAWLDPKDNWVVVCRVGGRSAQACLFLASVGYQVRNLEGGMNGWVQSIDPSQPRY